jgi:hypothetical protein
MAVARTPRGRWVEEGLRALGGDEADVEARCLMALSLWIGNPLPGRRPRGRSCAEVLEGGGPAAGDGLDPAEFLEHPSHGIVLSEAETHLR